MGSQIAFISFFSLWIGLLVTVGMVKSYPLWSRLGCGLLISVSALPIGYIIYMHWALSKL